MSSSIPNPAGGPAGGGSPRFGEFASDALRYWEPRRLAYNAVLLAVVVEHFVTAWPESKAFLTRDPLFVFFMLAVLANIAYCASYGVDLFVQFSGSRVSWGRRRWVVFAVGTAFAAVVAHFFTLAILGGRPTP